MEFIRVFQLLSFSVVNIVDVICKGGCGKSRNTKYARVFPHCLQRESRFNHSGASPHLTLWRCKHICNSDYQILVEIDFFCLIPDLYLDYVTSAINISVPLVRKHQWKFGYCCR